jgi:glycosyltransferase involved in cell wall biosynthesis
LVVDNGIAEETSTRVKAFSSKFPQHLIRYVRENIPGSLSGRHRGALKAESDILVFIDDDVDVVSTWLSAILDGFHDPGVHLVGGRSLPIYEVDPPKWMNSFWTSTPYGGQMCIFLSLIDLGDSPLFIDAKYVWSLNLAIRRKTLLELGGFHPDYMPAQSQRFQGDGETGLAAKANAAGLAALYQPGATVYHRIPRNRLTPSYFEQRAFFEGVALSYSAVRRTGAVSEETWRSRFSLAAAFAGTTSENKSPVRARWRELGFQRYFSRVWTTSGRGEKQLWRVKNAVQLAFLRGFEFHHREVSHDPRLLEWVLREDYFNCDYQNYCQK